MKLEVHPVTPERWADFETVMGPRGAYAGCWCMWWRVESRRDFDGPSAERNGRMKRGMKRTVRGGVVPGVLAYVDVYMGTASAFEQAGFREVARTPNGKPIMRKTMRARRR